MIAFKDNVFHLATKDASYIIGIYGGRLVNLYYGKRIICVPNLDDMCRRTKIPL